MEWRLARARRAEAGKAKRKRVQTRLGVAARQATHTNNNSWAAPAAYLQIQEWRRVGLAPAVW